MTPRITRFGVLAMAALLPLAAGAQLKPHEDRDAGAFVIMSVNGDTLCREATPEESVALRAPIGVATHVFGEGRARIKSNAQAAGLNIILHGTDQLEASPEAKAAFEKAAEIWESRISTPVEIIVDVDYGPKRFGTDYPNANIIGSTGSASWIFEDGGYTEIRAAIVDRADNAAEAAVYNALPDPNLPTDANAAGFLTNFGAASALLRALKALPPQAADDVAPYRGNTSPQIGFNSAFNFDFDPTDGIAPGKTDFVGVAVHEMGHMLGFSSRVGATETGGDAGPSILDFFRFRPGVDMTTFGSAQRI
ncbi:MAG TPA: NF038122 family metalloprotease, partial [Thermoanaerobaculia bacterium]|nr:NF038122 family metalloprotease [Thermoanaerobaculia bacterium]